MKTRYGQMKKEELKGKSAFFINGDPSGFIDMCRKADVEWPVKDYEVGSCHVIRVSENGQLVGAEYLSHPVSADLSKCNLDWQPKPDDDLIKIVELCGKEWPDRFVTGVNRSWLNGIQEGSTYPDHVKIHDTEFAYNKTQFNACVEYLNQLDKSVYDNVYNPAEELIAVKINQKTEEKEMKESKLKPGDWINISNLEPSERKEIVQYMIDNGCSIDSIWDAMSKCNDAECLFVDDDMTIDGINYYKKNTKHLQGNEIKAEDVLSVGVVHGSSEFDKNKDKITFSECGEYAYIGSAYNYKTNGHPSAEMAHLWTSLGGIDPYLNSKFYEFMSNKKEHADKFKALKGFTGKAKDSVWTEITLDPLTLTFNPKFFVSGDYLPTGNAYATVDEYLKWEAEGLPETVLHNGVKMVKEEADEIKREDIVFNEYGEALSVYYICEDKGVLLSDLKWYDSSDLLTGKKGADVKALADILSDNHILSSFDSWNAAKVILESDFISVNSGELK